MKRASLVLIAVLLLNACASNRLAPTDQTSCAKPGAEETDGGIGGTGLKPCEKNQ